MRRVLGVAFVAALLGAPASAQDLASDGLKVWKDNGCFNCHGNFGEGGEGGHFPAGPSLRATALAKDALHETIACGRPGTEMPYNLKGAYTQVSCYGIPVGAPPPGAVGGVAMTPEQLDALTEYVFTRLKGKGRVTKAECGAYFGDANAPDCADYR